MFGRVNKYTFFLWLTRKEEVIIEGDTAVFTSESTGKTEESSIEKTHPIEIFLLKLLPTWLLFGFMVHVPDIELILIGVAILVLSGLVLYYLPRYFKKYLILLSIVGLFLVVPRNDLEIPFEQIVYVMAMFLLFLFLAKETYSLFYEDDYYFLQDVKVNFKVKGTRTSPGRKKLFNKIPFFGLTNKEKRVNLGNMSFSGYYLRVKKGEKDEAND